MTFLQALYGSQHKEIALTGKDGNKGRLNGNLFLSAFIIVALFVVIMLVMTVSQSAEDSLNGALHKVFGYSSGKTMGKLLAIPLLGIIYFAVISTIGSEANFQKNVAEFYQLPEDEQAKANKKLLVPFFVLLGVMLVLALGSLGR